MSVPFLLHRFLGISDDVWERHANPLSGWSRIAIPALFAFAIWGRTWFGWWCLVLIAFLVLWTCWNTRAFSKPKSHDHWMTHGVLGERIWLNRKRNPISVYHFKMAIILAGVSALGLPVLR